MRRVASVLSAGNSDASRVIDRVILDADDRQRRRIVLTGEKGTRFLLDRPQPVRLRDGDALVLDDGAVILVTGAAEPLMEIAAKTPLDFVRLAWHLGNRHAEVQIGGGKILARRDHVLAAMVAGLGATVSEIEAPFDPEEGASEQGHSHGHTHDP